MQSNPDSSTIEPDYRVFCPMCGYELTPIPQGQCSECGFGYNHKAIRFVATDFALNRISSYETAIVLAAASAACFIVPPREIYLLGRAFVVIGLILASINWRYFRWNVWTFSIAVAMPALGMLILWTNILLHAAIIMLALSAAAGFYHRTEWRYISLSVPKRMLIRDATHRRVFLCAISIALIAGVWRVTRAIL